MIAVREAKLYSHAHVTNRQPELHLGGVLSLLSFGAFWRGEARDVGFPKLELQEVNPPPERRGRWDFCFYWALSRRKAGQMSQT